MTDTKPIFDFECQGYRFVAQDDPDKKGDARIQILKGGRVVRTFGWPAYKVWNLQAHAGDIVDGLEKDSDDGLRLAGSTGLGGTAYAGSEAVCYACTQVIPMLDGKFAEHISNNGLPCPGDEQPVDAIRGLIAEVVRLHDVDAKHKRGWRLSDRTANDALLHTIEELTEVGRATTRRDRTSELGDVLACLIHFAIKAGISLDDAARAILSKLPADFPETGGA